LDIDLIRDYVAADLTKVFWETLLEIKMLCAPENEDSPFNGISFDFERAFHLPAVCNQTMGNWTTSKKKKIFFFQNLSKNWGLSY